ncbi:large ribosomal subunit protein bL9m [Lepeophtheirus salmonis]|uniref:large ribosomal subunit protein bL9m n=1 Tax=Lepeophtheirus salmonis TaxID=72036 RepID=UPI001AE7DEB3|nr:39S ribosomal protein L9, mitochondrial-like [Lepeophtheirus salmonis]
MMFLLRRTIPSFIQSNRRLIVVERVHQPRRFPDGTPKELMERLTAQERLEKHQTYRILQEEDESRDVPVLLLANVEGIGRKGSVISLSEDVARQKILLPQLGIYPTEEALSKYKDILIDEKVTPLESSEFSLETHKLLSRTCIGVRMSGQNPWTLTTKHISSSFLLYGFIVPPDVISIPREIAGPNRELLEDKEFYVTVKINGFETAHVRCVLKHTSLGMNNLVFPFGFQYKFREPIFEEDRELLISLPREPFTQKAKETAELEDEYVKYMEWYDKREKRLYKENINNVESSFK